MYIYMLAATSPPMDHSPDVAFRARDASDFRACVPDDWSRVAPPWQPIQGLLSCALCYLECKERWPTLCSSIGVALEVERSLLEKSN